jgi:hypothetical protein
MSQVGYGDPISMPPNDLSDDRFSWTLFILFGQLAFSVCQASLATFVSGI